MTDARLTAPSRDVTLGAASHPGTLEAHNDDTFVMAQLENARAARDTANPFAGSIDEGGVVLLVCDGIGGAAGQVAAWIGSEAIVAALRHSGGGGGDPAGRLLEALSVANRQVFAEARVAGFGRTMGAACTACWIRGARAYFAQVGDSRGYLLRGQTLYQTTWDQTTDVPQEQVSGEHARMTAHAETLLHALGATDTVDAMVVELDLRRDDRILLCTDGLHHVLPLDDIRAALAETDDPSLACARLIRIAVERGAPENLTAVVARCEGPIFPASGHDDRPAYRSRLLSRR